MLKMKVETKEVLVVKAVTCHKCEQTFPLEHRGEFPECMEIQYSWGWSSQKDGETHRFHLCEPCYDKLVAEWLTIAPEGSGHGFDPEFEVK